MHIVELRKEKQSKLKEERKKESEQLREQLSGISCTIPMQAGEDEKLFGSVTADMIAKAFEAEGVSIDKKDIQIDEQINKLGVYNLPVKLHPEITATLKVWVVQK
jgi:large subunit ribosomal protein L9